MDDRIRYVVIEYYLDDNSDIYETLRELEEHLINNGYDYFLTLIPRTERRVLIINEEQTGYIDTVLEDRNIYYEYI